jgi:L-asparaginase
VERKSVLILGTGGTIAGKATVAGDNVGYRAGEMPVQDLLAPLVGESALMSGWQWDARQVVQLDSKDMDLATWRALAQAVESAGNDPDVTSVVITHGTDTLEETAFFLSLVLRCSKPVVLTCAMRPATALMSDGPQNLLDALAVATNPHARGVCVVMAGTVHSALSAAKVHTYRLDAFSSGDSGPIACIEEGRVRWFRANPQVQRLTTEGRESESRPDCVWQQAVMAAAWPRVELITSHAGADGALVHALLQPVHGVRPLEGLVVAGTGNGTVHAALLSALDLARAQGVVVWRTTRCAFGQIVAGPGTAWPPAVPLSPVKARIALALALVR